MYWWCVLVALCAKMVFCAKVVGCNGDGVVLREQSTIVAA